MCANIVRRGLMLVLSSPSGAGKTTLSRGLLASDDAVTMSVSMTTRPPRPGEVDGEDYIFVDPQQFGEMRNRGELLEFAKVFEFDKVCHILEDVAQRCWTCWETEHEAKRPKKLRASKNELIKLRKLIT